uniref:Uncharacterized protein n=1 Tax=Leersia perrieri TaxID=77586 RepID=A0A0D9WPY2_9ORYZ
MPLPSIFPSKLTNSVSLLSSLSSSVIFTSSSSVPMTTTADQCATRTWSSHAVEAAAVGMSSPQPSSPHLPPPHRPSQLPRRPCRRGRLGRQDRRSCHPAEDAHAQAAEATHGVATEEEMAWRGGNQIRRGIWARRPSTPMPTPLLLCYRSRRRRGAQHHDARSGVMQQPMQPPPAGKVFAVVVAGELISPASI